MIRGGRLFYFTEVYCKQIQFLFKWITHQNKLCESLSPINYVLNTFSYLLNICKLKVFLFLHSHLLAHCPLLLCLSLCISALLCTFTPPVNHWNSIPYHNTTGRNVYYITHTHKHVYGFFLVSRGSKEEGDIF